MNFTHHSIFSRLRYRTNWGIWSVNWTVSSLPPASCQVLGRQCDWSLKRMGPGLKWSVPHPQLCHLPTPSPVCLSFRLLDYSLGMMRTVPAKLLRGLIISVFIHPVHSDQCPQLFVALQDRHMKCTCLLYSLPFFLFAVFGSYYKRNMWKSIFVYSCQRSI